MIREHYEAGWELLIGGLLIALLVWGVNKILPKRAEKQIMSKRARKKYVERVIEDMIANGLEELRVAETLTDDELRTWYNRIARSVQLQGLYFKHRKVKPPKPDLLKQAIRERLGDEVLKKLEQEKEKTAKQNVRGRVNLKSSLGQRLVNAVK